MCATILRASQAILTVLAFLVVGPATALAEMQVVESNVLSYPVGSRHDNKFEFKLLPGERVKVLLLHSKKTRVFEGARGRAISMPGGSRSLKEK